MKFFTLLVPMFVALALATPTPVTNGLTTGRVQERQECRPAGSVCSRDDQCCGEATCELVAVLVALCEE
ncbi:hypothetical protein RSOLAG22IIIB_09125 [Rhizoctonia solani]|uniref:Uncharacterized protein n=1 Tax=Rhizoctonia solani TaxID=456999 RepID=A0A0K6FXF4_9AGAM|nr:hypothetical protein RSOLAG22IIIB_09125 [Rhizoctonia solani]